MTEKKNFPFSVILAKTNNWLLKRTSGQCRKKEDMILSVFPSQNITYENGCFKTQTRNWKWSRDALFWAENLTCICTKQPKNSNICLGQNDRKKEFPFFGHFVHNKYLFKTQWPKKGNYFFRYLWPKQIFRQRPIKKDKDLLSHPADQLKTILFYCTWHLSHYAPV